MNGDPTEVAGGVDGLRRLRPLWIALTVVIIGVAVYFAFWLRAYIETGQAVGVDYRYYLMVAQRWLDTGIYYTDRQLDGPFVVQTLVDNLYPPHALYLFVPLLYLPWPLWWGIPLGIVAYVVWWCRPPVWSWPILALCVMFPKTINQVIYGNTDMWIAAFIAAGVRWAWPAVLVTIKPSLVIFAVIGIRSRAWWIAAIVLAVLSLPLLGLWLQYPTVMLNSTAQWYYSFGNLPFFILPVLAWLVSSRRAPEPIGRWSMRLLGGRHGTTER